MFRRFRVVSWNINIISWFVRPDWDNQDSSSDEKPATLRKKLCEYSTFPFAWVKGLLLKARVQWTGIDMNTKLLSCSRFGFVDAVHDLVKDGADVNAKDKNGQSALMIAAHVGYSDIVKHLVAAGADVNAQDIYNKSALWLSAWYGHMDIVQYLIKAGAQVDVEAKRDDNSNAASAITMAAVFGHKETVHALIGAKANINSYFDGKTLLSVAATSGHKDVFLALRAAGATENRDSFFSMLEYCIKNGHLDMSQLIGNLLANDDTERSTILRKFDEISFQDSIWNIDSLRALILLFDKLKIQGKITKISTGIPFQDTIDYGSRSALRKQGMLLTDASSLPEDIVNLPNVSDLIKCPGIGNINCLPNGTAETIKMFTEDVVYKMVDKLNSNIDIQQNLGGLNAIVVKCGSAAEGTKTVMPDEFDYDITFRIDKETRNFGQVVDFRHDGRDDGYKLYSHGKTNKTRINSQTKGSKIFHIEFFDTLMTGQAVENIQTDSMVKGGGQPNTTITIIWTEPETNNKLRISVDLVPVLQFVDEWPEYLKPKTWLMDKKNLKKRGFCLVAKPPYAESALGKSMRENDQEYTRTQLWRISFSHLEAEHIASLPPRVRDAYVAAKCLRNPDVCRIMFRDKDGILNNVDKYVSSYMLKTVFLHNVEDFLKSEKSLIEMVDIIYRDLERYLEKGFLPLFWQPEANHIAGMKGDPKKALRATKLMREFVSRLKTREMEGDAAGTELDGKLTGKSILVCHTDPLKAKKRDEELSDNKTPRQCLPALCPLGYYVFQEEDVATGTGKNSLGKEDCTGKKCEE